MKKIAPGHVRKVKDKKTKKEKKNVWELRIELPPGKNQWNEFWRISTKGKNLEVFNRYPTMAFHGLGLTKANIIENYNFFSCEKQQNQFQLAGRSGRG